VTGAAVAAAVVAEGAIATDREAVRRGGVSRLFLLLLALLVALAGAGCGTKKAHKSEAQVVVAVKPVDAAAENQDLQRGADALVKRLEVLGVPRDEVNVVRRGGGLAVEFPRGRLPTRLLSLATKTATLELYDLEHDVAAPSKTAQDEVKPAASIYGLLAGQQPNVEFRGADQWELFSSKTKKLVAGPFATPEQLFKTRIANARHIKPGQPPYVVFGVPKRTVVVFCGTRAIVCPGFASTPIARSWYLFEHDPDLTGNDLNLSATRADIDPSLGPVVLTEFKDAARAKFQALTRALYQRGVLLRRPQHIAIVVDGEIKSFPQIDYTDSSLANGINGDAQITGLRSEQEATALALALQAGALPFRFVRLQ